MKNKVKITALAWIVMMLGSALIGCSPVKRESSQPAAFVLPTLSETVISGEVIPQSAAQNVKAVAPYVTPVEEISQPPLPIVTLTATNVPSVIPTLPPTSPAPVLDAACLDGVWQVNNLPEAMSKSYAQSGASLGLQGVDGHTLYEFDDNGSMKITFEHLAATFSGTVDHRNVTAVQSMDGSATAHYQVDAVQQQMMLSDFGGEGIHFGLDINGQRLMEGNLPVWRAFTSGPANESSGKSAPQQVQASKAAVTCQGKQLHIRSLDPFMGPDVVLYRVK